MKFKIKNERRVIFALILGVLLIVSIACGSSTPTSEPVVRTSTSETSSDLSIEEQETIDTEQIIIPTETSEPTPLYLGDIVEENGYFLSATTVEDPTTPGMFYSAAPDTKLVAVEVIVGNNSNDSLSVNPLYFTLLDTEGFTYQTELGGRDGQISSLKLSFGEKVKGWISFEMQANAIPESIKFDVEIFGDKVLKTSLIEPPDGHIVDNQILLSIPPKPEANLGDVFEQFDYSLSASIVEDPTTPGMLYQASEGYKLIAVEFTVGNISGDTLSVNPLYALLVDNNGFVYSPELGGRNGQIGTGDLGVGEKSKGWVSFEIPNEAIPFILKYQIEIFSENYLQVALTN